MKDIISVNRPFVVCEILPAYAMGNMFRIERQQRIEAVFLQMDYKIAQVRDELIRIEGIPLYNDVNDSNYLFYPVEDESMLKR